MAAESVITTTITAEYLPSQQATPAFCKPPVFPPAQDRHYFLAHYSDKGICSSERLRYLLSVFSLQLNKLEFEHSSY